MVVGKRKQCEKSTTVYSIVHQKTDKVFYSCKSQIINSRFRDLELLQIQKSESREEGESTLVHFKANLVGGDFGMYNVSFHWK